MPDLNDSEDIDSKGPFQRRIPLENIYLDPNNYRFRDHQDYKQVDDNDIILPAIQSRTKRMILGGKTTRKGVSDLITSFKKVGFQPVERIKVQRFGRGRYKVIEGNRRITALKLLQEDYNNDNDIGEFPAEFFEKVPVDIFSENDNVNYYLIAGLNHIGGKVKWPAINIATYIKDLENKEGLNVEDIYETFGINKQQFNYYKRTLSLIDEYKNSDFGDQFTSDMYFIFEEIVKKPSFRDFWLNWDYSKDKPTNIENTNRLFGWISQRDERIDPDDENSDIKTIDPLINQGREIRDLEKILKDKDALETMEDTESLSEAINGSAKVKKGQLGQSIERIDKQITEIQNFKDLMSDSNKARIKTIISSLDKILETDDFKPISLKFDEIKGLLEDNPQVKLSELTIIDYKLFDDLKVENINQINIFAGNNNIGKSTLLEAINFLIRQNDLINFIDIFRRRGKFYPNTFSAHWMERVIPERIKVKGIFNNKPASTLIERVYENEENYNKQIYVTSFTAYSQYGNISSNSIIRLYDGIAPRVSYEKLNAICNIAYSSPFTLQNPDNVLQFYDNAVKLEIDNQIIELIKESGLDSKIESIKLTKIVDVMRFIVQHRKIKPSPDLTSFGDGMQRIYYIGLHFAAAANGILLIDELENAIHHDLLVEFTKFIQLLSERFNVQVFITSHSKECIDAFITNDCNNDTISFYRLEKNEERIECKFTNGEDFARLLDGFDIDLRG